MKQDVFRTLMLRDLGEVLACAPDALPAVFLVEGPPKPLKIGTYNDVRARFPGADAAKLSRWFRLWTSRHTYAKAVCFGTSRSDLDGNPAGTITDSEREHARKTIASARREAASKVTALAPPDRPRRASARPILHLPSMRSCELTDNDGDDAETAKGALR